MADIVTQGNVLNETQIVSGPKITIIGVGGGGSNTVDEMFTQFHNSDINFIACNTDAQVLKKAKVPLKILLGGKTYRGLGAGGDPQIGKKAAEESIDDIKEAIKGSDLVFVSAGMGGGTGTGAIPVICKACKDSGALTIAVVTKPFNFEGKTKTEYAANGLTILKNSVDSYIVVSNDKLVLSSGDFSFEKAMKECDKVLSYAVKTIVDVVSKPGIINLDFADVRATLKNSGLAVIGFGEASGESRAIEAARKAVSSNLLEVSIRGAGKCLINIVMSKDVSLKEVEKAVNSISNITGKTENITFGALVDESLTDKIIVSAIATSFGADSDEEKKVNSANLSSDEFNVKDDSQESIILPNYIKNCIAGTNIDSSGNDNVKKIKELTDSNKELQEKVDDFNHQIDVLNSTIAEKKNDIELLNSKLDDLKKKNDELQTLNTVSAEEKKELDNRITKLETKIKENQETIDKYERDRIQNEPILNNFELQKSELEKKFKDLNTLYEKACQVRDEQTQRAESYQSRLALAFTSIENLSQENKNVSDVNKKAYTDLKNDYESIKAELTSTVENYDKLKAENEQLSINLDSISKTYETQKNDSNDLILSLSNQVDEKDKKIEELEKEVKNLTEENKTLNTQINFNNEKSENNELQNKDRINSLINENENLKSENNSLHEDFSSLKNENQTLNDELLNLKKELTDKESFLSEYHNLKVTNESLTDENLSLKSQYDSLLSKATTLLEESQKVEEYKDKIEKLTITNSDLVSQLNNKNDIEDINKLLEEENNELKNEIEELNKEANKIDNSSDENENNETSLVDSPTFKEDDRNSSDSQSDENIVIEDNLEKDIDSNNDKETSDDNEPIDFSDILMDKLNKME